MYKKFETELAGRKLVIETGRVAELSNGNAIIHYGDTVVMVNVTASKEPKEGVDFFPLSVDYEEKLYAVGKIPGSFTRREGKPADKAILTSRAIDRPIRPLFPKDFRNDVCVVATVLSVEEDNSPEVCAMIGASVALSISDIYSHLVSSKLRAILNAAVSFPFKLTATSISSPISTVSLLLSKYTFPVWVALQIVQIL